MHIIIRNPELASRQAEHSLLLGWRMTSSYEGVDRGVGLSPPSRPLTSPSRPSSPSSLLERRALRARNFFPPSLFPLLSLLPPPLLPPPPLFSPLPHPLLPPPPPPLPPPTPSSPPPSYPVRPLSYIFLIYCFSHLRCLCNDFMASPRWLAVVTCSLYREDYLARVPGTEAQ